MKIAVFGGTGRVGRHIVGQALEEGHDIRVLTRNPTRVTSRDSHLAIVAGDVLDPAKVAETLAGCEAVLCALGGSGLINPGRAISIGTQNIVSAMKQHGPRRIIVISAFGMGDSRAQLPMMFRVLTPLLRGYRTEKETQERILRDSGLDWTIVRPFQLTDAPKTGSYYVGANPPRLKPLSRADLADFMLKQLTDNTFLKQAPQLLALRRRFEMGYRSRRAAGVSLAHRRPLSWRTGNIRSVG